MLYISKQTFPVLCAYCHKIRPPHGYNHIPANKTNHVQLKALISGIAAFVSKAKIVVPSGKLSLCRDPEDNMFLECCLAAKADILIPADKDLLDIQQPHFKLKIMTPAEFLKKSRDIYASLPALPG